VLWFILGQGDVRLGEAVSYLPRDDVSLGERIFREQRIENIMKQISRWYNVDVTFAGKPTQEGFTASIPRNVPVSKVLRYLELTTLVHFKIDGNRITVLP